MAKNKLAAPMVKVGRRIRTELRVEYVTIATVTDLEASRTGCPFTSRDIETRYLIAAIHNISRATAQAYVFAHAYASYNDVGHYTYTFVRYAGDSPCGVCELFPR